MAPTKTWKKVELKIAKILGGERRGADYGGFAGGKNDVILPGYSIEIKHTDNRPTFYFGVQAYEQAKSVAKRNEVPVGIVHMKGQPILDSLCYLTLYDLDVIMKYSEPTDPLDKMFTVVALPLSVFVEFKK